MKNFITRSIVIELKNEHDYEETCSGCPTIFEFTDKDGHQLYFYLRHSHWILYDETTCETLFSGVSDEHDGICSWDEAIEMMNEEGVSFSFGY